MAGNECVYVCADDPHGTATMLLAERNGTTPEELIEPLRAAHAEDFRRFHISHDNYYSTHSPENEPRDISRDAPTSDSRSRR